MKKLIKEFKFLDHEDNQLSSRALSIIDWVQEGIKEKEYMGDGENEDQYMEHQAIDEKERMVRNEPPSEGY